MKSHLDLVKREFFNKVDQILKANGFKRAPSRQWIRRSDEVTHLIDFQASNYGPGYYYINLGINVNGVETYGDKSYHLSTRLQLPGRGPAAAGLDLMLPNPEQRLATFVQLIQTEGMDFFSAFQTIDDVCKCCTEKYMYLRPNRYLQEFCGLRSVGRELPSVSPQSEE